MKRKGKTAPTEREVVIDQISHKAIRRKRKTSVTLEEESRSCWLRLLTLLLLVEDDEREEVSLVVEVEEEEDKVEPVAERVRCCRACGERLRKVIQPLALISPSYSLD